MSDWRDRAACHGIPVDMFFPPSGQSIHTREFKMLIRMCESCPVQSHCLSEALSIEGDCGRHMRHGIWGGKTPNQRNQMVKGGRVPRVIRDDNLCPAGLHDMCDSNVYVHQTSGYRECRSCRAVRRKKYEQRKRAS